MKKLLTVAALVTLIAVVARADRADMDRLLADMENHNTHLGELVTTRDSAAIKKSVSALREDVKALGRKSTGLSERSTKQLEQRIIALSKVTEDIEQAAEDIDFNKVQASYKSLQPQIEHVRRLTLLQPSAAREAVAAAPRSTGDYLTDVKNHAAKLEQSLKAKDAAQVRQSTGYIREDLKAWVAGRSDVDAKERRRLTLSESEIVALTGKIERNVTKGEWGDAQGFAQKLDKLVAGLQKPATSAEK